ncbi:MAG: Gfo/Idh/MocA family oxidoreductase [Planctomycetes bacterium]|nr:Gfo/Idh/MocA family oxidoreductase [Planctomycetota bacterium]
MLRKKNVTRRQFLAGTVGAAAGAIGFPYIVSSSALGRDGSTLPSNRIVLGFIGVGKQGSSTLLKGFLNASGTQVVAVCDVDALKRKRARNITQRYYANHSGRAGAGSKNCTAYSDFRNLLVRSDIDAVVIATPDHWHAITVIQAARAGKDIYCEKPLSLTIAEARAMVNAVRRYERVLQTGSMQRSDSKFRFACELVRSGYIGEVKTVTVDVGGPSAECYLPAEAVPAELDWNFWLGPAPWRPYNSILAPPISFKDWPRWRNYRDYSGGAMTDWGAHHFDIAQWALGMDDSGPVEIIPPDGKDYKVLTYKYANGVTMIRDKIGLMDGGILFVGTEGRVAVTRGYLRTWPDSLMSQQIGPDETHLYKSNNHYVDFLNSVRDRSKPICDVEIGCRSATVCHLGNIAYQLGRPLKWDPGKERFVNDPQADRLLSRPMRSPWHL